MKNYSIVLTLIVMVILTGCTADSFLGIPYKRKPDTITTIDWALYGGASSQQMIKILGEPSNVKRETNREDWFYNRYKEESHLYSAPTGEYTAKTYGGTTTITPKTSLNRSYSQVYAGCYALTFVNNRMVLVCYIHPNNRTEILYQSP